jgi:hypothetical protein
LILVIIERLTKYILVILYKELSNAKDLAYAFLKNIVVSHGILKEIISDRDKLFILKF